MRTEVEDNDTIKIGLLGNEQAQEDAILKAYERYAKPLASYVRERVAPTFDADELATVVSQVFCDLARKARVGKFRSDGSLTALLFQMARCKSIDTLRRKSTKRRKLEPSTDNFNEFINADADNLLDEDQTIYIAQKLSQSPKISAEWRTAVDEAYANEIMRQFRILVGNLPRLQRKVAEVIALHCGDVTDAEIASELEGFAGQVSVASVKSARREIGQKFRALLERRERINTP